MLCLSCIRIIELEINERIIIPFCRNLNINQLCADFTTTLDEKEKKKFYDTWGFLTSKLAGVDVVRHEGIELGTIFYLFDSLKKGKFKKGKNKVFAELLKNEVVQYLSKDGLDALETGKLAEMVEPKVRKKYRNPLAHTKYVGLEVALECREYVEKELLNLAKYCLWS